MKSSETAIAGGTFALYSLICRHAKVSLLPNRQVADEALSTYLLEHPPEKKKQSKVKLLLEKHRALHTSLLILVLLGTCMVIGDGLLTPAISGTLLLLFPFSLAPSRIRIVLIFCFVQFSQQFLDLSYPCPRLTMSVSTLTLDIPISLSSRLNYNFTQYALTLISQIN